MTGVTAIGVTGRGGTVTAAAADKRRNLPRPPFNLKFLRVRRLYTMILVTVKVSLALASSD